MILANKADVPEIEIGPLEASSLAYAAGFLYNTVSAKDDTGIVE